MSKVIGCDVGSLTTKAVILNGRSILGSAIIPSKARPEASAEAVIKAALDNSKISMEDISYCVGTGYGREKITIGNEVASEITCHAKGARWMFPSVKTIIDIGGQDCKAIRLDDKGDIVKFAANDKCASGTGRFLEVMAKIMHVGVDELGELARESTVKYNMAATCALWAQAEVIKRLNSGFSKADIAAGINNAMASRAAILVNSVGIVDDVLMTGGVAKNKGVVTDLENLLGHTIKSKRRSDPQLAGALGAAIIAKEAISKQEVEK